MNPDHKPIEDSLKTIFKIVVEAEKMPGAEAKLDEGISLTKDVLFDWIRCNRKTITTMGGSTFAAIISAWIIMLDELNEEQKLNVMAFIAMMQETYRSAAVGNDPDEIKKKVEEGLSKMFEERGPK